MPRAAQQQAPSPPAVQQRPVRNRKIKQKGYEFEVLSKVQSSNCEDHRAETTTANPAPLVKHKPLALAVPTPKRKRRHALFLGQASKSGSSYSFTPGKKRKHELQSQKSGRPRRLPAAADPMPDPSTSAPVDPASDPVPATTDEATEPAQLVIRRPGRPLKVRPPRGDAASLGGLKAPVAQESAKSSRHLRAEQRAQQRAKREVVVQEDDLVDTTRQTDVALEGQRRPTRRTRTDRDGNKQDSQRPDPLTHPDSNRDDFLGQRKRQRLVVNIDSAPGPKATPTISDKPIPENGQQVLHDGNMFSKEDSPQNLTKLDHTSPFVRALQRRPHLARFLTHNQSVAALPYPGKMNISTTQTFRDSTKPSRNGASHTNGRTSGHTHSIDYLQQLDFNAEDLLPDPMLSHVVWIAQDNAWNPRREQQLRLSIGNWAANAASAAKGNDAELWMWRLMIHFFKAMPHELWRYGLRPHRSECWATGAVTGSKPSEQAYNPSYDFCLELGILLCHPVWNGDLMKLRFALQTAICSRIKDHEPPVAGLDGRMIASTKRITDMLVGSCRKMAPEKELELMCKIQSQYYHCGGIKSDQDIQWLTSKLASSKRGSCIPTTEEERLLFFLRTSDMEALREVLDAQESHGQAKWRPAVEYCRIFAETPAGMALTGEPTQPPDRMVLVPADHLTLARWKTECFIAERRERLIREEALPTFAMLFDIPRGDPQPYHVFSGGEFSEAQQRIVTGTVTLPEK
ncbi:hypothetical protein PpBr36_00281 [Pyricularia pennisetigena]|uniref:hypothetical protein n=1 Tax=Pyricularia pennisetigena TaxID=1578925 RepID=UPI00114E5DF0|nr:hypothetical protein PpBr36_00281 [Pyricularia pennisetigena]TLS28021.1 hypothetical protein PpBr36_00281 [Pyricularia pennisetigena]